ncbi:PQ loop repeat-domain-containing protein [Zychaea mexicana]|uniref:PQ loop repeat-domain-containing protein n=1 Tax=Zychaea mexicana TaxID=64656 RepID=UPI0022FF223B|nr:PQ loop repeat-domain-containing protein [Zychaea mexicana]KAI9494398.1 PQ loop repeat-domain-containing protein [Zychaea mexicana]
MADLASMAMSLAMSVGPAIGYVDQYLIIRKHQSSAGFNPVTCGILLFSNILRVFFWLGKRFDTTLLIQSLIMIAAQLVLLEIVVLYRPLEKHEQDPLLQHHDQQPQNNNNSSSSSSIKKLLLQNWRTMWAWDHYLDYVNFLLGLTTVIAVGYQLLGHHGWFVETLGVLSLGIESTLPLPQCVSNFKRRSTAGFSAIVMATWFVGDSFKLFYFIFTQAPVQFDICGAVQLAIDSLIVMQSILFSTRIKKWLGVSFPSHHFYHHYSAIEDLQQHSQVMYEPIIA